MTAGLAAISDCRTQRRCHNMSDAGEDFVARTLLVTGFFCLHLARQQLYGGVADLLSNSLRLALRSGRILECLRCPGCINPAHIDVGIYSARSRPPYR